MPRAAPLSALLCLVALFASAAGVADPKPPSAAEWRRHCDEFLGELGGKPKADDLAVTYCVALTSGVLAGLRFGSQLGAVGMASRLTVLYGLDSKDVFESFKTATPDMLIQVCPPAGLALYDYVLLLHGYLKDHDSAGSRPLPEVLFEALQAAYPCGPPPAKR